ncbi:hypothetical protein [Nocardioides stalactiti]|nr:hypothetical protein [Nocardioides stalactiti]
MTLFLLLIAILAVAGVVASLRELGLDRPREIPRSHPVDRASGPPARFLG